MEVKRVERVREVVGPIDRGLVTEVRDRERDEPGVVEEGLVKVTEDVETEQGEGEQPPTLP